MDRNNLPNYEVKSADFLIPTEFLLSRFKINFLYEPPPDFRYMPQPHEALSLVSFFHNCETGEYLIHPESRLEVYVTRRPPPKRKKPAAPALCGIIFYFENKRKTALFEIAGCGFEMNIDRLRAPIVTIEVKQTLDLISDKLPEDDWILVHSQ